MYKVFMQMNRFYDDKNIKKNSIELHYTFLEAIESVSQIRETLDNNKKLKRISKKFLKIVKPRKLLTTHQFNVLEKFVNREDFCEAYFKYSVKSKEE